MSSDEYKLRQAYYHHRRNYGDTLGWNITYEEWERVWEESGLSELRGSRAGESYVCRIDDSQPWTARNVQVLLRAGERAPSKRRPNIITVAKPRRCAISGFPHSYPDSVIFHVSEWRTRHQQHAQE